MFTPTLQTIRPADASISRRTAPQRSSVLLLPGSLRVLLMLIIFAGSAVYAASYRLIAGTTDLTPIAAAIGIAAGIAWIGFGFLLLMVAQMHPRRFAGVSLWHWADVCLLAMSLGMAIKMIGVGGNVLAAAMQDGMVNLTLLASIQLALLVITDVSMGFVFAKLTARLGMPLRMSCMLWIVALNGIFAVVLVSLLAYGGFMP